MSQPKVSIIVPVYNAAKYVGRCLESIKSQTYKNIEVIFVNDGSADNSGEIIEEFASSSPNVMALHQENQGPAAARRNGVLHATGDYVMFLDSDDSLPDDAVEYMVTTSLRDDLDAFYGLLNRVIGGKTLALPSRDYERVMGSEEMILNILDPNFVYHAAECFSKRSFWDADMFCNNRNLPSEDILTNLLLVIKCKRIGVYNKPVYNYHLVDTSLTMTGKYFGQECFRNFFDQLSSILKDNGLEDFAQDQVRILEIHTFGFYITEIKQDEWYKRILAYDVSRYPRKIKVLHVLLRCPWLLHLCVKGNRWFKRLTTGLS